MINDKIKQFISISVTGHVFMFCTREGIKDPKQIRQYEKRTREHLVKIANEGADIQEVEKALKAFLEALRNEIHQQHEIIASDLAEEQKPDSPQPKSEPKPGPEPEPVKPEQPEKQEVAYSDAMFAEE